MNSTEDTATCSKIREFVLSAIHLPDLADDDNLFESGIANSLFAVELMTFLEKEFGVEVTSDDLEISNFQSISAAAEFVARKKTLSSAG